MGSVPILDEPMRTAATAIATPRTAARRLSVVVAALLTLLGTVLQPAAADAGLESGFVQRINAERASNGLPELRLAGDLVTVARRHSQRMADSNDLHHNPNLGSEVSGWQLVGENVGKGPSVDSLHSAFMASPGHRANILHTAWLEVGVGVVVDGDRIWVTQVFRQPKQAQQEAEPAPSPTPTPEERTTAAAASAPAPAPAPSPVTTAAAAPTQPAPLGLGRLAATLAQVDEQDEAVDELLTR